jgi:L-asparagine transporter-like permease
MKITTWHFCIFFCAVLIGMNLAQKDWFSVWDEFFQIFLFVYIIHLERKNEKLKDKTN